MSKRLTRSSSVHTEDGKTETQGENGEEKVKKKPKVLSGFDNKWLFKFDPQPPEYPLYDVYFDMKIYLVDKSMNLQTGYTVPLVIQLMAESESVPLSEIGDENISGSSARNPDLIEIHPDSVLCIDKNTGYAHIQVKVKELSRNRQNRKFVFLVRRVSGPRDRFNLPREINPTMSSQFQVVNSRLRVSDSGPWEDPWYKDQGGRDKCIEFAVSLIGENGVVTGMDVPLRCVLVYETGKVVRDQNLLTTGEHSNMQIDGSTGTGTIRVRIEDVSKNHQNQRFKIRVEPDTSATPIHGDKAPDYTRPVIVRSKLNKRQREKLKANSLPNKADKLSAMENNFSSKISSPQAMTLPEWANKAWEIMRTFQQNVNELLANFENIDHDVARNRLSEPLGNVMRSFSIDPFTPLLSSDSTASALFRNNSLLPLNNRSITELNDDSLFRHSTIHFIAPNVCFDAGIPFVACYDEKRSFIGGFRRGPSMMMMFSDPQQLGLFEESPVARSLVSTGKLHELIPVNNSEASERAKQILQKSSL